VQIARSGGVGKRLTCETMEPDGEAAKPVKSCIKVSIILKPWH